MEDSDDDDIKLREEIEAELDKISISSLEQDGVESDSKSETQSEDSDIGSVELPESVLQCINIIKNKSKTVEELILQDIEDTDFLSCSYGAISNNPMHLRIGLSAESKENPKQLMKILSEIEKEEFMRSKTHCASPDSVPEPDSYNLPVDELVLPDTDDTDINFGYFEVEERCRQSFEAWQDKQKELEDKEIEILRAQRDREEKQLQEEEEKRHCWLKQFEDEKKKLESIQKEEEDKINDELYEEEKIWEEEFKQHEEFMKNLHLQLEEERIRFEEFQRKEKMRLLKLQHNAATKIQAKYKALITYRKYSPIIREQIQSKKRKAQEWKEKETKIRQKEEEKRKRLEEEQQIEDEIKKQKEEERQRREKEYEEKKSILRQEIEELRNKEAFKLRDDAGQHLIIGSVLKKGECNANHLNVEDMSKNKGEIVKELVDETSKKNSKTDIPLCLVEDVSERKNVGRQPDLEESIQVQMKLNRTILAELQMEENYGNLLEYQCCEKSIRQEMKYENIDKNTELQNLDIKENMSEQFQLPELKSQTQKHESVEPAIKQNVEPESQIVLGHNQEANDMKTNKAQKIIRENEQKMVQKVEKEEIPEKYELSKENNTSFISINQKLSLKLENFEAIGRNTLLQEKEIDLKSKEIEENSKDDSLSRDIVIFNTTDARINIDGNVNKYDCIVDLLAPKGEYLGGQNAKSSLVTKEISSLKSEIIEIPEECHENRPKYESIMTCSMPQSTLPSSIEEKRLAWIKSFKPWFEILKQNQQKKIVKRKRPVKCPANTMPPLNTLEILQCGPWKALWQVTTITFQNLPGCGLSTLAECINLQFLSLQCCGLTSLHSLSNCKKLKYIDAQENHIETINCENLENLCVVLLNKNQLTSLHGLDGCTNILNLELSHNKITRIGGLESLKNLQQLVVDHNQLISTKGLCDTPTIIYLDCSYNHLTDVEGIENCGLLQTLKLQGNYLSKPPSLENHVLLRELHLDDNSISTMEMFSSYWLPLLQTLTISQNSLTKIVPLFHFISLEKLDISNNCLSDLKSAIKWFEACYSLHELSLTGNPLLQEIDWRHSLLKILPALRILNGDNLNSYSAIHTEEHYHLESVNFLEFCQSQIREFNSLIENYTVKRDVFTLDNAENLCCYFKKLMTLSNEYRYAHEHGDVTISLRGETGTQEDHMTLANSDRTQDGALHSCANKHKGDSSYISEQLMNSGSNSSPVSHGSTYEDTEGRNQEKSVGQKREDSKTCNISTKAVPFTETAMANSLPRHLQNTEQSEKIMAAVVIQACWRGYIVRRQINFSTRMHSPATEPLPNPSINNQTTLKKEKRENILDIKEQREKAAICIQAVWKGFILRKKLMLALEAIKNEESEEDYEEIDLEDFTFDEEALEKEWLVLDSSRFPSQTLLLSNQLHWPKVSETLKYDNTSLNLPSRPALAWLCNEKENFFSSEYTQLNSRSENRTLSCTPESKTSRKSLLKSEKEEKISEEWGFKDISTAQQMLKRAQKMKSKKLKNKLDPTVRLTLFKNNENNVTITKSSKKTQPRRNGHIEGKEEDFLCKDNTANEKLERGKEYTYQWLHTQVGAHSATGSKSMKCNHFLPELDPDVLNGGRVQLVARLVSREDTDLDLFSMTSGSALSVNREKKSQAHRHSAGSSSCSIKGILAPMITNTRPSKRERISFRDNPVQLSGGWGSGKKKAKTSN